MAAFPVSVRLSLLFILVSAASAAASPDAQVLVATDRWVEVEVSVADPVVSPLPGTPWVEVTIPGYGHLGDWGAPELPVGGLILAIPPDATPSLTVLEVEPGAAVEGRPAPVATETILEGGEESDGVPSFDVRLEPDPARYDGSGPYPTAVASLGDISWMRHQRVVTVQVTPVRWDPRSGVLVTARRIRFRVDFGSSSRLGESPARRRAVSPRGGWERVYERRILNYEAGRSWRRAPSATGGKNLPSMGGRGPAIRIHVRRSGVYRLTQGALAGAGLPGSLSWDEVTLWESLYDETNPDNPFIENRIPYVPEDTDGDGNFDPGESLVFFGQDRWDRLDPREGDKRFGRDNTYWLRWDAGPPEPMETVPSWLGLNGLPAPPIQVQVQVAEKDSLYGRPSTRDDRSRSLSLGTGMVVTSHYTWTNDRLLPRPSRRWAFFHLPRGIDLLEVRVELQGIRNIASGNRHTPSLYLSNNPRGERPWFSFPGNPYVATEKSRLDVVLGQAELATFTPATAPDSNSLIIDYPDDGHGMSIDRIVMTYERDYFASEGTYYFHTEGMTGPQEFHIDGFQDDDLLAFEITDSVFVSALDISEEQISVTAEGFEVALQVEAGDGSTPRRFYIIERGRIPQVGASALHLRNPADLTAGGTEDYVAIYHADFADSLEPLLVHRESLGHRVLRVDVEDAYDVFNGGRKSPVAIRSLLRYLFRTRGEDAPEFLLLVGDASDDHANIEPLSDFNYLPTMTLPSWAGADQGPELVSNDAWFVDNLNYDPIVGDDPETMDFFPDMHIGRLPAGNTQELSIMVRKILRYENFRPEDTWRNRGIFLCDDQYSSTISFTQDYCYRTSEWVFERGGDGSLEHIFDAGFLDFAVDSFYLRKYLDTLRVVHRCRKDTTGIGGDPCDTALGDVPCDFGEDGSYERCQCVPWEPSRNQGGDAAPGPLGQKLLDTLNRGALVWNVQSHANKNLIGHEWIFKSTPSQRNDVLDIQNLNKPFIFFGFGCHLAEFSEENELTIRQKDCIGERLLYHGSRDVSLGAVASVASTGYEWLGSNDELNTAIFESFFTSPPQDDDGQTQWLFGEILTGGKNVLKARNISDADGMILTYSHLGDPALRVDLAPPRLHVSVDDQDVDMGFRVVSAAPDDTVRVEVGVLDEVSVNDLRVDDYDGTLPTEQISILRDENRPDRAYTASFGLKVRPATYPVAVRAADRTGRERVFTLSVDLITEFTQLTGGEELRLDDGDFVSDSARIIISLDSPAFLEPDDIEVQIDGIDWQVELNPVDAGPDDAARIWRVLLEPVSGLTAGQHSVGLAVLHEDGKNRTERSVTFRSSDPTADLRIEQLFNFPNPFEGETEFHYELNSEADRARLSIFTVRGQKIRSIEAPARINRNVVRWNGRDEDGDEVANGLYFYKLEVWDLDGKKQSRIERIARAR